MGLDFFFSILVLHCQERLVAVCVIVQVTFNSQTYKSDSQTYKSDIQ